MKVAPLVLTIAILGGIASCSALAQSPTPSTEPPPSTPQPDANTQSHARALAAKWNVILDVQMIAVPLDLALVFIPDLQSPDETKVNAAISQLQDLLKKKQAILLGWPRAISVDGERNVSEAIVEKRYPTEFDPSLEPQALNAGPNPEKQTLYLVPRSFVTRGAGVTLEVEPQVLNAEGDLLVNLVAGRVIALGNEDWWQGVTKEGLRVLVSQPQFVSTRITTSLKLRNGQYALIGVHQPPDVKDHLEFVIVHAVSTKAR